jgi:Short C-terminal domain
VADWKKLAKAGAKGGVIGVGLQHRHDRKEAKEAEEVSSPSGGPRQRATEALEAQLGRSERLFARKGVQRLPEEIREDEMILLLAVGEIPRRGLQHAVQNAEFAVLAATDQRFLVASRLRSEDIAYESMESVQSHGKLVIRQHDGTEHEFKGVMPAGRDSELAATIEEHLAPSGVAAEDEPALVPPSARSGRSDDVLEHLQKLGELREAGLITSEEFDAKKQELLARL